MKNRRIFDTVEEFKRHRISDASEVKNRRSVRQKEAKYDRSRGQRRRPVSFEMYRDVSMIIVRAEAIFLFAVTSTGLTSSRSNFYGIPWGSFYDVERLPT